MTLMGGGGGGGEEVELIPQRFFLDNFLIEIIFQNEILANQISIKNTWHN